MKIAGNCRRAGLWSRHAARGSCFVLFVIGVCGPLVAEETTAAAHYHERIEPILEKHCYSCHGFGERKGGTAFDEFKSDSALVGNTKLWLAVLKNVRSGLMPPKIEERLSDDDKRQLFNWIEFDAFGIDRADPDPGRVTLRRLNRVEYRNTIRDLMGIDFDTRDEFPADDSGYGFDNIGDALSVSPLLMEKYLNAAEAIVAEAVPTKPMNDRKVKAYEKNQRVFINGPAPADAAKRDEYARRVLDYFSRKAYRRPVDAATVDRLAALAKIVYDTPGQTFEAGVSRAMVAVLSSPRFLFRVEGSAVGSEGQKYPTVDEYALASRLSYFLWSTMPDDELMGLAEHGELRANLPKQVKRMVSDPRSHALSDNFAGQWLRARDIEAMEIEPIGALGLQGELERLERELWKMRHEQQPRAADSTAKSNADAKAVENKDQKSIATKVDSQSEARWQERETVRAQHRRLERLTRMFSSELRRSMRDETLAYFDYIVRENRNVSELIDSNYTFVNEKLAKHYGIEGVKGDETRRVELPVGSPRGGVLTQATLLAVTSNPSRTSPVKRGLYILDNILGAPAPPPPPPNVPILEVARDAIKDHQPTIREAQEAHRREPLCQACHARMDPLGLALENFNAMGMWRDSEHDLPIDASGVLMTGEKFDGIRKLKAILKEKHRLDFYRCLSEKLLTYAVGRGLEYYDEHTLDVVVEKLDRREGKFSAVLMGVVESAPFQKQRRPKAVAQVR